MLLASWTLRRPQPCRPLDCALVRDPELVTQLSQAQIPSPLQWVGNRRVFLEATEFGGNCNTETGN